MSVFPSNSGSITPIIPGSITPIRDKGQATRTSIAIKQVAGDVYAYAYRAL